MAKQGQNLPLEKNFYPNQRDPKTFDKPHLWEDGEYVEHSVALSAYPKVKYHADYVHNQKPGKEYGFTESAQMVNTPEEEKELGAEWKDAPNMITCPNAKQVAEKQKALGSNWRAALELPADISQMHVEFLQSQGMGNINNINDAHAFLAKLGSAAMNGFMKEAEEWNARQGKRRKSEVA